ncbi:MFS transporter [Rhizobium leguminosarum]|uniref:MFS transporter n=1 Tax=Rhizobium leguminosarum TaxID=384 RepID=UPI001C93E0A2|nr:MFS transporter [Rhizobium leguminosarum]
MALRTALIDLSPLTANKAFRWLWISSSAQTLGRQITTVAVLYQLWDMTRDTLWVGTAGIFYAVPTIACALWGGAVADRFDRRSIILVTSVLALLVSLALAWQAVAFTTSLGLVLLLVAAQAGFVSLGSPATTLARTSLLGHLHRNRHLVRSRALSLAERQKPFQAQTGQQNVRRHAERIVTTV